MRSSEQSLDLLDQSECRLADQVVRWQLLLGTWQLHKIPAGKKRHVTSTLQLHPRFMRLFHRAASQTWTPLWSEIWGAVPAGCCTAGRPAGGDSAEIIAPTEPGSETTPAGRTEPGPPAEPGNQGGTSAERRRDHQRSLSKTESLSGGYLIQIQIQNAYDSEESLTKGCSSEFTRWGWDCRTLRIHPTVRKLSAVEHLLA